MHVNTINSHRIDFFLSEINLPLTPNFITPKNTLLFLYKPFINPYFLYSYLFIILIHDIIQYFPTTNSKYIF